MPRLLRCTFHSPDHCVVLSMMDYRTHHRRSFFLPAFLCRLVHFYVFLFRFFWYCGVCHRKHRIIPALPPNPLFLLLLTAFGCKGR